MLSTPWVNLCLANNYETWDHHLDTAWNGRFSGPQTAEGVPSEQRWPPGSWWVTVAAKHDCRNLKKLRHWQGWWQLAVKNAREKSNSCWVVDFVAWHGPFNGWPQFHDPHLDTALPPPTLKIDYDFYWLCLNYNLIVNLQQLINNSEYSAFQVKARSTVVKRSPKMDSFVVFSQRNQLPWLYIA